ncbi:hypothetical protein F8M41_014007 [Gigaspora margarita]|uniref:Uncharacterized protein n=1 Tax=Gigaspora margarita TaxID=4874 RepID=A0A8H3WVY9_GIGMA|nr:hypothetical protein F8M41_014007 [Gigaspora margarita]
MTNIASVDQARDFLACGEFIEAFKIYDVLHKDVDISFESSNLITELRCKQSIIDQLTTILYRDKLTSLEIRNNIVRLMNIAPLIQALCATSALTSLNIENNRLGDQGGAELAMVLCENTKANSFGH